MSLLFKINRYLAVTEMPPTKFGRLAINDPRLVNDLRKGRQPRATTVTRVETFIAGGRH